MPFCADGIRPIIAGPIWWQCWSSKEPAPNLDFLLYGYLMSLISTYDVYEGTSFLGQKSIQTWQILLEFYPQLKCKKTSQVISHD
jgi:hypothetical protein